MSDPKQTVSLTPEQLQQLVSTAVSAAVAAATNPSEEEQEELVIRRAAREQAKQLRQSRGEEELRRIEARKLEQKMCSHIRPDNTSHVVHIFGHNNITDYLICQGCRARIHAEPRPEAGTDLAKEFENDIFDTQLFNTHYRMSMARTTYS